MEENKKNQDEVKKHLDMLMERTDHGFKLLGEQVTGVASDVALLKDDMDHVKSDIVDIKLELKIMNGKLDNKAEKEVVVDHEKRLVRLENTALPKVA